MPVAKLNVLTRTIVSGVLKITAMLHFVLSILSKSLFPNHQPPLQVCVDTKTDIQAVNQNEICEVYV